ncbi:hypothetical protein [Sneathiella sp.]|jgi:hypothetical protein|uniref:hypothetical protein n=1 Tax=Sneathiella sp. TaxID=1964365 RepID=UPI0039E36F4E
MTGLTKKIVFAASLLWLLGGCAVGVSPKLSSDANTFRRSVDLLSVLINTQYEMLEDIHQLSLSDSIDLQLTLGGSPALIAEPLLSDAARLARKKVLDLLRLYAYRLSNVLSTETPEAILSVGLSSYHVMETLKPADFNLSHSLDPSQAAALTTSMTGFAKILFLPRTTRKLSELTKETQVHIRQLVYLFFADLGSSADLVARCRFSTPALLGELDFKKPTLCRGGIRGLMKAAVDANLITLRQRLQLLSTNDKARKDERRALVGKVMAIQKFGRLQDSLIADLQESLLLMLQAHAQLAVRLQIEAGEREAGGAMEKSYLSQASFTEQLYAYVATLSGRQKTLLDYFTKLSDENRYADQL